MKTGLAELLGEVSLKDCLIAALLVFLLVAPVTCAIYPTIDDDELQTYRN